MSEMADIDSVGYVGIKKCNSGICPFGELSVRGNVIRRILRPELSVGELSLGEKSVGEVSVGKLS